MVAHVYTGYPGYAFTLLHSCFVDAVYHEKCHDLQPFIFCSWRLVKPEKKGRTKLKVKKEAVHSLKLT